MYHRLAPTTTTRKAANIVTGRVTKFTKPFLLFLNTLFFGIYLSSALNCSPNTDEYFFCFSGFLFSTASTGFVTISLSPPSSAMISAKILCFSFSISLSSGSAFSGTGCETAFSFLGSAAYFLAYFSGCLERMTSSTVLSNSTTASGFFLRAR